MNRERRMDRRLRTWFDLQGRVKYTWTDLAGTQAGAGFTQDMSQSGMLIVASVAPPAGTIVRFEVSFPFRDNSQVRMRAQGRVLRVEADRESKIENRFAIAADTLRLDNLQATEPRKVGRTER
jgi:hypothetical protein